MTSRTTTMSLTLELIAANVASEKPFKAIGSFLAYELIRKIVPPYIRRYQQLRLQVPSGKLCCLDIYSMAIWNLFRSGYISEHSMNMKVLSHLIHSNTPLSDLWYQEYKYMNNFKKSRLEMQLLATNRDQNARGISYLWRVSYRQASIALAAWF